MGQNGTAPIMQEVQKLLTDRCRETRKPFALKAASSVQDGDWTYIVVEPDKAGVHSEDYIEVARWVEDQLLKSHPTNHILLVPARPQD